MNDRLVDRDGVSSNGESGVGMKSAKSSRNVVQLDDRTGLDILLTDL